MLLSSRATSPFFSRHFSHGQWLQRVADAASAKRCQAPVQHALHPTEFVTTRSARTLRIRPTDSKVHGHHEFALANNDHEENPINAREHSVFLATPPGAHEAQLLAVLLEY